MRGARPIEQHDAGVGDVGLGGGQHLLFAAAQGARRLIEAFGQAGKHGRDGFEPFGVEIGGRLEAKVVADAERREGAPALGNVADAPAGQLIGGGAADVLGVEDEGLARRFEQARRHPQQGFRGDRPAADG
jgi:hypothetical protein